jgi:hypothetical protein
VTLQAAQQYIAQLAFPLSFDHLEHIIIWVYKKKKNYIVTVKERGRGGEVNFQMQTN